MSNNETTPPRILGIPCSSHGDDSDSLRQLREQYARRVTVTGHRPQSLGKDFRATQGLLDLVALEACYAYEGVDTIVYTGMALGWDISIAAACERLGVPYVAVVPCINHPNVWQEREKRAYALFLQKATLVHCVRPYVCVGPTFKYSLFERNTVLLNQATEVLALYDGRTTGGTYDTIRQAGKRGLPVANAWGKWEKLHQ